MGEVVRHEDDRRILVEFIQDMPIRSCKVITMKQDGVIGNHYHENKYEVFYVLQGEGHIVLDSKIIELRSGDRIEIPTHSEHTFFLKGGSILLEASSMPYDPEDEHAII